MARLVINLTSAGIADDDALIGFPCLPGQVPLEETHGDIGIFEIDLGDRDDTTAAQELYLNSNRYIIDWSVERGNLHETEL